MTNLFFHEARAELINKQQAELVKFDSQKAEYNVIHDLLEDILSEYPDTYTWQSSYWTTITIPETMSRAEFNKWLDYLEAEYLTDYNMVRNDVQESTVIAEYIHGSTDGRIHLEFTITQCKTIETKEYKTVYTTNCHWE